MESEEDEQDGTICVRPTPGQHMYSKQVQIPCRKYAAGNKLIKVGVIVSVDQGTSGQQMAEEPTQLIGALALPQNVQISDLPENITLMTEWYETEKRKTIRMRIKPEPNSPLTPEALRFNLVLNYTPDEDGDDEESGPIDKGVQTDIALGELLFSDSISSLPHVKVEKVAVQTYITAMNVSDAGDEVVEQGPVTSIDEHKREYRGDIKKTSAEVPQKDEEDSECCACIEE